MRISRRNFMQGALTVACTATAGLGGYAGLIAPEQLRLERVRIRLRRLPPALDGLRIGLLSDLHFAPYTGEREIRAAVEMLNRQKPDLVALTGDFVSQSVFGHSRRPARFIEPCSRILAELQAPLGRYAVLGNHDHATDPVLVAHTLAEHGVRVLGNRNVVLEREGARLWLAGVDDGISNLCDFERALAGIPAEEAVVLLAHEPDLADQSARFAVDLQLSGHSHGGQVRVPLLGAPWLPPLGRKYSMGLYQVGPSFVYTTRGVGVSMLPFRFACPPEVTLLELRAASEELSERLADDS